MADQLQVIGARGAGRRARRRTIVAVLAALALVFVAACSSDGSAGSDGERSSTTTAAAEAVADVSPPDEPGPYQVGRRVVQLEDTSRGRPLTADVWYPADDVTGAAPAIYQFIPGIELPSPSAFADAPLSAEGPFPLVVYSHGSGGLRYVAAWFTELLASHGFVVVAVDHTGNTALDAITGTGTPRDVTAQTRVLDTEFLITDMLARSAAAGDPLSGAIDPERIGVTGHSFGGFTALASASGFASPLGDVAADERVIAVAAMSPASTLLSDAELESVDVPTLLVSGTLDTTTPIDPDTERPWELIPGRPLIRVDIDGAGHQSFTDVCRYQRELATRTDLPAVLLETIDEYALEGCAPELADVDEVQREANRVTVAFLLTHVAGVEGYERYLTPEDAPAGTEVSVKD